MSGGGSAGFAGFGCVTGDGRWVVGDGFAGFAGFGLWEIGEREREDEHMGMEWKEMGMAQVAVLEEVNGTEGVKWRK